MAGRRASAPAAVQRAMVHSTGDTDTDSALSILEAGLQKAQERASFAMIDVDLTVGKNVVPHSLGRVPRSVVLTTTVADVAFAWAIDRDATSSRQVVITVIGCAQPRASLLLM